jgi:hypothetical protein
MTRNRIPILLLALFNWGATLASDVPAPLLERVHGSDVAKGARYYEEYRRSPKDFKPKLEEEAQEGLYLFMSTVSAMAQSPMDQLAYFCVPENVPAEALYEKVAPIILREKWLWPANGRVLVLAALGSLYPCADRTHTKEEGELAELALDDVTAAGRLTAFQMGQLPEDVRTRISEALRHGTGHVEVRTRLDTSEAELVFVPSDGSKPETVSRTK